MASEQGRSGLALRITGGRVLLPTGELADTDVVVDGGVIDGLGTAGNGAAWDARGLLVLPGIIDLHGDAFERQIMPRPGVAFPMDVALQETDRQLASNGITTAYHAVTYSWEPGLRGRASVIAILDGLKTARPRLGTDTRFHLRFETYNLDAVDEVEGWLADGTVDLLAFNEHMLPMIRKARRGDTLSVQTGRASMNRADFVALLERLAARENEVPGAIARLAGVARANGIPMASHDDRLADERRDFNQHGCSIAEFPMTQVAADTAMSLGNPIVLGAPNVLRGGSHLHGEGITAAHEVRAGRCSVLCSDYYYPALPQAPFRLAANGDAGFAAAWRLISTNPAEAAGLTDRGRIEPGRRADLVLIDDHGGQGPAEVVATLVAGRPVHRTRAL